MLLKLLVYLSPALALSDHAKSTLNDVKSGILLKNGKQTSCGLALIDNKATLASGSCFALVNNQVKDPSIYEIIVNNAFNNVKERHRVEKVDFYSAYSSDTMANDVALLQYNSEATKISWANQIAIDSSSWESTVYVSQYVKDLDAESWADPVIYEAGNDSNIEECMAMSSLFKNNQQYMVCNSQLADSPSDIASDCDVPYQIVYGVIGDRLYLAGFFSYIALKGTNATLCNLDKHRSYYTLVSSYLYFASLKTGRTMHYLSGGDGGSRPQTSRGFSMNPPTDDQPTDIKTIGGNIYTTQTDYNENENGSGGLSKKNTIIVAVCCSAGGILLAVAVLYAVRWNRSRKNRKHNTPEHQEMLANDLGGASFPKTNLSQDNVRPPPYHE